MPLDAVMLDALARELDSALQGAKIDRVQQPEKDLLLFSLRTAGGNKKLLVSVRSGSARVHFTAQSFENPAEPPMFCMLLRKHLTGARILSVTQPDYERMLLLRLTARDEMGDASEKTLAVELIGKSANAVLVGSDGRIIDCLRRMDYGGEGRAMLPGMIYRLPPRQDKTPFYTSDEQTLRAALAAAPEGERDKWLLRSFSGLCPLICRELDYRASFEGKSITDCALSLRAAVRENELTPTMLCSGGAPMEISFTDIRQYGESVTEETYADFSTLLDAFFASRELAESRRRRSRELLHMARTAYERSVRKLAVQESELAATRDREEIRRRAELITANIYRIKRGDGVLVCEDYFTDGGPEISIELDRLKTPQQNAAALYKEFNRKKAAEEHLRVLIEQGRAQSEYLAGVIDEIERAESERDLADIRRELAETGFVRKQRGAKTDRTKPRQPLRFVSSDGLEILVGRNNTQNDELTFRIARRSDLWLHVQKLHGSHVIIRTDGLEPPQRSVEEAASLAVYYSQACQAGKAPVDVTQVRNVKKQSGALPGAVIYTDQRTVISVADEGLAERLAAK